MKAMLLRRVAAIDDAPLSLEDLPVPEPGAGEIRPRVHCSSIWVVADA